MSKTLHMAATLKIDTSIGTETVAILGRRGSGKSNTGTVFMEELLDKGEQIILIDPKGEGWGLKARGGESAGKDVIVFGEPEGDLPLREEHAETVADFVVSSGRSVVLSLNGFDSQASERRFVTRFAERLYQLKRQPANHSPVMVVLEEASLFVPQRVDGEHAKLVSTIQRLVRQGRSFGIGVTLIDQRAASVNKDVLTQVEVMICHQLTSPHDRKAVDAWIEANAEKADAEEFRKTLPTLQPGECWVWSPAKLRIFERATIRRRSTFDSGATPVLGKNAAKRPDMRPVNIDELKAQLEQVVEDKKANDPTELKATIRKLNTELHLAKMRHLTATSAVKEPLITDKQIAALEALYAKTIERMAKIQHLADTVMSRLGQIFAPLTGAVGLERDLLDELVKSARSIQGGPHRELQAFPKPITYLAPRPDLAVSLSRAKNAAGRDELSGPERKILDALAWWMAVGVESPSIEQVGIVAGYSPSGGSFGTYLSRLSSAGLIQRDRGIVFATGPGRDRAQPVGKPPTLAELHDRVRAVLDGPGRKIIDVILAAGGTPVTTECVGSQAGYEPSGGSFGTYLSRLSTLGLITRSRGVISPTNVLFPEGLR